MLVVMKLSSNLCSISPMSMAGSPASHYAK
jgi:hypothetical protein